MKQKGQVSDRRRRRLAKQAAARAFSASFAEVDYADLPPPAITDSDEVLEVSAAAYRGVGHSPAFAMMQTRRLLHLVTPWRIQERDLVHSENGERLPLTLANALALLDDETPPDRQVTE